jgi:hypothetical protein
MGEERWRRLEKGKWPGKEKEREREAEGGREGEGD